MIRRALGAEADNKKIGMRLEEVAAFVQQALRNGATGDEQVVVTTTGWAKQRIKTAAIEITSTDAADSTDR